MSAGAARSSGRVGLLEHRRVVRLSGVAAALHNVQREGRTQRRRTSSKATTNRRGKGKEQRDADKHNNVVVIGHKL